MDSGCYASVLAPDQTGLGKLIGDYIFEGSQTESQSKIEMELHELNVYSEYFITMPHSNPVEINIDLSLTQLGVLSLSLAPRPRAEKRCLDRW